MCAVVNIWEETGPTSVDMSGAGVRCHRTGHCRTTRKAQVRSSVNCWKPRSSPGRLCPATKKPVRSGVICGTPADRDRGPAPGETGFFNILSVTMSDSEEDGWDGDSGDEEQNAQTQMT